MTDTLQLKTLGRQICEAVVDALLAKGWSVDVGDRDECVAVGLHDRALILEAMFSADADKLIVHAEGMRIGWVLLVHGNDANVISDYTASLEDTLTPINEAINRWEAGAQ